MENEQQQQEESTKLRYSFVVPFGVPEYPPQDFDANSMARRLTVMAICLDQVMREHEISAELVIVEWVPTEDTHRLLKLISWESLGLKWLTMVRIIQVLPETTKLAPACRSSLFPVALAPPGPTCFEFVAKNVGARRAHGKFLVLLNIDDILTPQLGSLFSKKRDFFREKVFYRAARQHIRSYTPFQGIYQLILRESGWTPGEDPASVSLPAAPSSLREIIKKSDPHTGDFLLLSKKEFFEVGGFPEIGKQILQSPAHACSLLELKCPTKLTGCVCGCQVWILT